MPRTKGATNLANRAPAPLPSAFSLVPAKERTAAAVAGEPVARGGPVTSVSWQWVIDFVAPLLGILVPAISSALRDIITKGLQSWYDTAKASPNPWDDFLVKFIAAILKVDLA